MSENIKQNEKSVGDPRDKYFGAFILIAVGLLALVGNITQSELLGMLIVPVLGLTFLVWGIYTRRFDFIIPGCILSGIGFGTVLSVKILQLNETAVGGVVVLGLALGFLGITFISTFINSRRHLWALIPGTILGVVGILLLIGGEAMKLLTLLGVFWPVILVVIGVYILFQPKKRIH